MFIDREKTRYCACGNYTSGTYQPHFEKHVSIHKKGMDGELRNRVMVLNQFWGDLGIGVATAWLSPPPRKRTLSITVVKEVRLNKVMAAP
jgi:hypothetical protein